MTAVKVADDVIAGGAGDLRSGHRGTSEHRVELGRYLRARREQIRPEDVGIVRARHRRARGLRRSEVAQLAAVSPTWYTWLEQGRDIRVSVEVLDAICRVLRLNEHASRYVRQLAGKPMQELAASNVVDSAAGALIADLAPTPACAVSDAYDLLAWNTTFARLIGDPTEFPVEQRNIVRMCFESPSFQQRISDWPAIASSAVAELRNASALQPDNERLHQLIHELRTSNRDFRLAWEAMEVRSFFGEVTRIDVVGIGNVTTKVMELSLRDRNPVTIFLFQPVDDESRRLLEQLDRSA
jgi:transcriptional regulator with XRE-family HTH domain